MSKTIDVWIKVPSNIQKIEEKRTKKEIGETPTGEVKIILRNNKHFFMPKVKEGE